VHWAFRVSPYRDRDYVNQSTNVTRLSLLLFTSVFIFHLSSSRSFEANFPKKVSDFVASAPPRP